MNDIGQFIVSFFEDDDMESFEIIYKHYHDRIFNCIRRYATYKGVILSKDVAEEIFDDVFVQIWRVRKKFKIESPIDFNIVSNNFKNWLFLVSRFKVRDYVRRLDPQKQSMSVISNDIEIPDGDQIKKVSEILYPLRKDIKKVILFLHYVLDFPYKLIAEIINDKELKKNEILKEATRLRETSQNARKRLEDSIRQISKRALIQLRNSHRFELSKRQIEEEWERLRDICLKAYKKLEELMVDLPDNRQRMLLNGYSGELELWMEALNHE